MLIKKVRHIHENLSLFFNKNKDYYTYLIDTENIKIYWQYDYALGKSMQVRSFDINKIKDEVSLQRFVDNCDQYIVKDYLRDNIDYDLLNR
jgi:signal peptidase I